MIVWRRVGLLCFAAALILAAYAFRQSDEVQPNGQIGNGPAFLPLESSDGLETLDINSK